MVRENDNHDKASSRGRSEKENAGEHNGGESSTKRRHSQKEGRRRDENKKPRFSKKTLTIGGAILGAVLIAAFLYWLHARNFESTDDAYTTAHVHDISTRVAGTIETVNVDDNQLVKEGQVLLTLDPRDFQVAAEQARAQVFQRKAASEQAQANQVKAQQDFDRLSKLGAQQVVSKQDVDNATDALKAANAALTAAKADLATAEAALKNAELQLSYTTVVAPTEGRIAMKTAESGARVQPGQALMAVVEQDVWVLGNFKETQLARMKVGQHVDVRIDALHGHIFSAHIDSLQPGTGSTFALLPPDNATGNFTKIVQRLPVKIVFDDLGEYRDRVAPGLSCEPKVDLRTGPH
jgi:membrane fusion protein (multidrug efflux system)